jgi:hypothetical protein
MRRCLFLLSLEPTLPPLLRKDSQSSTGEALALTDWTCQALVEDLVVQEGPDAAAREVRGLGDRRFSAHLSWWVDGEVDWAREAREVQR